jgi:undecaprenyl-diphosphatase
MRQIVLDILEFDRTWSYFLRIAEKPGVRRKLSMFFAHSGDSWFWGLAMLLLWLVANTFWKQWAVYELFWISMLVILVMALKFSIRRQRPAGEWGAIYRNTDPHSFPSGHAARAFLIAVLATFFGPAWLAILLWIWAPIVSLARVAMGVHYVSDVIAGAILGVLVALVGYQISPAIFAWISQLMMPFWGFGLW